MRECGKKQSGQEKLKSRRPITTESKNNNNKHYIVVLYMIWKTYNEIQLPKNKMDLNNRKIKNHSP